MVTGDGDGLSIGGNHLAHILRRNVDVNILLFNNEIYGLTKGQYSPTSPSGQRTKSSPMGSVDRPFNPLQFALGCNATFVARTVDNNQKHMAGVLKAAAAHKGTSFIEILQNCVIFNDGCFEDDVNKAVRDERTIDLRAGEPMVYGKDSDKGLKMDGWKISSVAASEATVWDPTIQSASPAFTMATLDDEGELPSPMGVLRAIEAPVYDAEVNAQIHEAIAKKGEGELSDLLYAGDTWQVE
jgi:2-oxoglutarate ferredoxin oxidoreductase subunit beta